MDRRRKALLLKIAIIVGPILLLLVTLRVVLPRFSVTKQLWDLGSDYRHFQSRNYEVYTTQPKIGKLLVQLLDTFNAAFYEQYGESLSVGSIEGRIHVLLLRDRADFDRFAEMAFRADLPNNAGLYSPARKAIVLYGYDLEGVLHEGTHMLIDLGVSKARQLTGWLSEGLAVYFENTDPRSLAAAALHKDEKQKVRLGGVDPRHIMEMAAAIRREAWLPLRQILTAERGAFQGANNSLYYGESAMLVAYLLSGPSARRREAFFRVYDRERSDRVTVAEFETLLETDLETLEADLKAWILEQDDALKTEMEERSG